MSRTAPPRRPPLPSFRGRRIFPPTPALHFIAGIAARAFALSGPVRAETVPLEPMTVTAARTAQPMSQVPFALTRLSGDDLRASPAATVDGALRSVPGFSLFRRSDSLSANPTAQGVSLRGLGPSGASRTLVLLDGAPLNDPFGGWIAWSQVPRESLAGVELVRGGGATAWGNAALGGVVQLLTEPAGDDAHPPPPSRFAASLGGFSTHSAELALATPAGRGTLQLSGRIFSTDGFLLVAPRNRGPVDIAAASRHRWLAARWTRPLGPGIRLAVTARGFSEARGNGTPYQRNDSRSGFVSFAVAAERSPTFSWSALAYAQDQTFASTFSAVNPERTAETPASDQFAVPAVAMGAAWAGTWRHADGAHTSAGADLRRVRGETRENFGYAGGAFTRRRVAGGRQDTAGLFALHDRPLAPGLRGTLGARLDAWREGDGHRRDSDRATGASLRDERYPGSDGVAFSPSAGLVWQPAPRWRLRAAAQEAFRRPTLNELYRPFRVGNVITEANAGLRTERVTGAEIGADYVRGSLHLGVAAFRDELRDSVGNVTMVAGPGTFPLFGFVPAGGVGRQRLNLDRTVVRGLELTAVWRPESSLSVEAAFLYDDARVRAAAAAPVLAGKRLAQVPRQSVSLSAAWHATRRLTFSPRLRWIGRQFEDDENRLVLGAVAIADLRASLALGAGRELFLSAENIGNSRVETGRSADGVVNIGTPGMLSGGLRYVW